MCNFSYDKPYGRQHSIWMEKTIHLISMATSTLDMISSYGGRYKIFLDVCDIVAHYSIEQESLSFTSQETRHALSSQIVSISLHWQVIWFFQYSFMVIIFRLSIVHVSRIRHQYWTDLKKKGAEFHQLWWFAACYSIVLLRL